MELARSAEHPTSNAVRITNRNGRSPIVLICDHASNFIPKRFGDLGLGKRELESHIAWDPGALPVARRLAKALDATLIESRFSRLLVDCNRPLDAPDLICQVSEATAVPGNADLSLQDRQARVALSWQPFHEAVEQLIKDRLLQDRETTLVSIHSFTPVYKGVKRPWHIGILHDEDRSIADPMIAALKTSDSIVIGDNEPYSPADRVYFTLERHGRSRGLCCAMIEIRNDEIGDEAGQERWAGLLAPILAGLEIGEGSAAAAGPGETIANGGREIA
jgi:predicted N-formylglutamate amidohydrolase